ENAENERTPHFQTNFGRSQSRRFLVEELHGSPALLSWLAQQFCRHLGVAAIWCRVNGTGSPSDRGLELREGRVAYTNSRRKSDWRFPGRKAPS
ncbi:hypothetical protein P7K49_040720, partial [Saguinus oedipus]